MENSFIIHLTHWPDWAAARARGDYRIPSLEHEGFIHCSVTRQILRVANAYYAGHSDLLLLAIDPALLQASVKWEPGTDKPDELFPHIYGPLNLDAVRLLLPLPRQAGVFVLPAQLDLLENADWREKLSELAHQAEGIRLEARLIRGNAIEYRTTLLSQPELRFKWHENRLELLQVDSIFIGQAASSRQAETLIRDYLAWKNFY